VTCLIKKNWLLGGYSADYQQRLPLTSITLSKIAHELLTVLHDAIPQPGYPCELSNLKGRERSEAAFKGVPPPQDGEVLSIGGTIATSGGKNGFTWSPFRFSCLTRFVRFEGNDQIIHAPELFKSESIPQWFPWRLLGAAAPIKIEYLRLGFENFSSRFSIARFGAVPVVSDTLLIDANQESLNVSLSTQQPRWQPCNPFSTLPLFKQVSLAVEKVCGSSPSEGFARELTVS
jgi:hypothetical protein